MFESLADKLRRMKSEEAGEPQFKDYDDVMVETPAPREEKVVVEEQPPVAKKPAAAPAAAVVTNTSDADSNIELKVVRPADFAEVSDIADYLLSGCTVVLNLEALDEDIIERMLDFLNGVSYVLGGDIENVSPGTFIVTPNGININK